MFEYRLFMDKLPNQHYRGRNAADALVSARTELAGVIRPGDAQSAWLFAHRVLEADDQHGRAHGLLVQGDGITVSQLAALFVLAEQVTEDHLADGEHRGYRTGCDTCERIRIGVRSTGVADLVKDRRTD